MLNQQNATTFLDLFRVMARRFGFLDLAEASCCGISSAQCRAILELGARDTAISLIDFADAIGVDKSTMSRTVDLLVRAGLSWRAEDGTNRRYVNIGLTDQGKDVYRRLSESLNHYFEEIWSEIPVEKRTQVGESMRLLADAIEQVKCC